MSGFQFLLPHHEETCTTKKKGKKTAAARLPALRFVGTTRPQGEREADLVARGPTPTKVTTNAGLANG